MKKIITLAFCLILVACSAIPPELLSVVYTPTSPPPTKAVTATMTLTITPTLPTPTFTLTPTLIGAKPTPTDTLEPTVDLSATVTPVPSTATQGPTRTPTQTQKYGGFASVFISTKEIYYGECDPRETIITATVQDPDRVTNVVAFFRFVDKQTSKATDWMPAMSLQDKGGGTYSMTLKSTWLVDYQKYNGFWVAYQLVSADKKGNPIGRTQIVDNSITLLACLAVSP